MHRGRWGRWSILVGCLTDPKPWRNATLVQDQQGSGDNGGIHSSHNEPILNSIGSNSPKHLTGAFQIRTQHQAWHTLRSSNALQLQSYRGVTLRLFHAGISNLSRCLGRCHPFPAPSAAQSQFVPYRRGVCLRRLASAGDARVTPFPHHHQTRNLCSTTKKLGQLLSLSHQARFAAASPIQHVVGAAIVWHSSPSAAGLALHHAPNSQAARDSAQLISIQFRSLGSEA
mmetsp:Transcript_41309/g.99114  ORF Transcript_41309/g.99114 Transcript_41309/m.99114 type:complete len:228 (-) Transcript_41309:110-793(-)